MERTKSCKDWENKWQDVPVGYKAIVAIACDGDIVLSRSGNKYAVVYLLDKRTDMTFDEAMEQFSGSVKHWMECNK